MNVTVIECFFLSRPIDEERKTTNGYRKLMYGI